MTEAATSSQTEPPAEPGYLTGFGTPLYRSYVLFSLLIVYIFNFIDRSIFGILTEPMKLSLKLEDWHMGLLGGLAFAIFYTTLGIPIARVAERRNRMMIIVLSLTLWSLMTVFCGFATSFITLFIFRLLVGVGEAGCTPPAQSVIADYFKPTSRATAASIYALGVPLGGMFAGLAAGPINDYITGANVYNLLGAWGWSWAQNLVDWNSLEGWRIAFIAVGLPGVLFALILFFTVKEPPRGYSDPPGAPKKAVPDGFSTVLKDLMKKPTYVHVVAGAAIASFAGYGVAAFSTSFLLRTHGLTLTEAALIFSLVLGLMAALGVFLSGYLADKMAVRYPTALSWMPALGMGLSVPLYWMGYLSPTVPMMIPPLMLAATLLNLGPDRPLLANQCGKQGMGGGTPDDFQGPGLLMARKTIQRVAPQRLIQGPGPGELVQVRYRQRVEFGLPARPLHLALRKFRQTLQMRLVSVLQERVGQHSSQSRGD